MATVGTKTPTTMKLPTKIVLLCTFLASAPTGVPAEDGTQGGRPPLDLSLPKEAQSRTWGEPPIRDATRLPDLGGQPEEPDSGRGASSAGRGGGSRSDLPYGAGYEARHDTGGGWGAGGVSGGGRRGGGRGH